MSKIGEGLHLENVDMVFTFHTLLFGYDNKYQKSFQMKTCACRDGAPKKLPNKVGTTRDTFIPMQHPMPFLPNMLCGAW